MTSKRSFKQFNYFFAVACSTALLIACSAKDRDTSFSQGQGENLLKISDFDGQTFEIITGELSQADRKSVDIKTSEKNTSETGAHSLPLVKFTTTAKLLQEVPLRGRPNGFKYQALYKITDNYLKIYQVGAKEDIDRDQQTYAEVLDDGRLAVPLMGYPIKGFYVVEKIKNSDNEETNKLTEISKSRSEASNFRIDLNSWEIFEAVSKENLFAADYFKGDWYYAATVVEAIEGEKGMVGFELGVDLDQKASNRVKFTMTENSMTAQNLNIDERLDKKNDLNLVNAISIPARWKDFELVKKGKDTDLRERENTTQSWNERKFVQLDLTRAESPYSRGGRLTALEMTDDYFSFAVQSDDLQVRIRYSFRRAPELDKSTYIPKAHFSEDAKIFGFFTTEKSVAKTFHLQHKEQVEKNIMISRFNPKAGKIVFHMTKTTPNWIRPAVREVIQAWDVAFVSAGTQLRIELDESFDVELGDIRYNAINMIESLTPGNMLGLGPSVTDPLTGEIISATTNVHLSSVREGLEREVRNYIRHQMGLLSANYAQGISSMINDISQVQISPVAGTSSEKNMLATGNFLGRAWKIKAPSKTLREKGDVSKATLEFKPRTTAWGREHDISITSRDFHKEIRNQCPEVDKYIADLKASRQTFNENESSVLDSCARKIMVGKVQGTLIHELGHNFGLRHNFMGSVDQKNFWPKEVTKTETPVHSSSVMEYPAFHEDRLVMVGAYDIAAIRYGYADSILLEDNKTTVRLKTNQTIQQNLEGKKARNYMFCTDEDVQNSKSPFCDRWDAGTTAEEIVNNHIEEFHTSTALLNYRYDGLKTMDPVQLISYRIERYYRPIMRFYEEWRLHLANYLGTNRRYLQNIDEEAYRILMKQMSEDPQYAPIYKAYKPTADRIYSFFKAVSMMGNRYCVVQNTGGSQSLLELDIVRNDIFRVLGKSVHSCTESAARDYLSTQGLTVVGQHGHFLNEVRFNLDPEKATDPFDVVGSFYDRWAASLMLTIHQSQSLLADQQFFHPSMMDEPVYRKDWSQTLEDRVIHGLDTKQIKKALADAAALPDRVGLYQSEKVLLVSQFEDLMGSLYVPNDITESRRRKQNYESTLSLNEMAGVSTHFSGEHYFVAKNPDSFAAKVANVSEQLTGIMTSTQVSMDDMKTAIDFIKASFPKKAELDSFTVANLKETLDASLGLKFQNPTAMRIWMQILREAQKMRIRVDLHESTFDIYGDKKQERLERFQASKATDFYSQKNKAFELTQEDLIAAITKDVTERQARGLETQTNRFDQSAVEQSAQLDLLKFIMIHMAD